MTQDANSIASRMQSLAGQTVRQPDAGNGTARDAAELRQKMERWLQEVDEYAAQLKRRAVAEVYREVVQNTPVDTGAARNAWRLSIGTPNFAESRDAYEVAASSKLTDRVFMVNPLPYIIRLNNGWSKQAPSGYIDQAIQRVLLRYASQGGTPR